MSDQTFESRCRILMVEMSGRARLVDLHGRVMQSRGVLGAQFPCTDETSLGNRDQI